MALFFFRNASDILFNQCNRKPVSAITVIVPTAEAEAPVTACTELENNNGSWCL
jgi:hypothetical protein